MFNSLPTNAWEHVHRIRRLYFLSRRGKSSSGLTEYEYPQFLDIHRDLALFQADAIFGVYHGARSRITMLSELQETIEKIGMQIGEIKNEAFQQRLIDELLHTFAVCDRGKYSTQSIEM